MRQNRYDRSYDNDREPEPEKTLKTRLKTARILLSERIEDALRLCRRVKKPFRTFADAVRERRANKRQQKEARIKMRERQRAEARSKEEALGDPTAGYGKDDFTQLNHIPGDGSTFASECTRKGERRLTLTNRFPLYLLLLLGAFAFTQGLQAKASNIFFGFVVFLPLALLLYTLTAALSLRMHMASDDATVTKQEPYTYEMRLINQSIFAYPFIEAVMLLPQSNSVRCKERSVYLSMAPRGSYVIKSEIRFRFRGSYAIGVSCFYVYDFFRIFRLRVDIQNRVIVRVLPNRLLLNGDITYAESDEPDFTSRCTTSHDRVEARDIRNYLPGDPLKMIHWNLTSRLEEPVVKDYTGGKTNLTYVYCDLVARFPEEAPEAPALSRAEGKALAREEKERREESRRSAQTTELCSGVRPSENVHLLADPTYYEDMNEYCADGIIDLALASALRELRRGNEVVLIWQDERSASGICAYSFRSASELSVVYPLFATAPLCRTVSPLFGLSAYAGDVTGVNQIFVTAMMDEETVSGFCEHQMSGSAGGEILLYTPEDRFLNPMRRRAYLGDCRDALLRRGIVLTCKDPNVGGET